MGMEKVQKRDIKLPYPDVELPPLTPEQERASGIIRNVILEDEMAITDDTILEMLHHLQDKVKAIRETRREGMTQEERDMTPGQQGVRARQLEDLEKRWAATLGTGRIKRELFDTRYTF